MSDFTLTRYDAMRQAIVEAHSIDDVKEIRDKAEALRHYARQVGETLENQNMIAEIKIRAERRGGELSREIPKNSGKRTDLTSGHDVQRLKTKTEVLREAGIDRKQANRWEAEAAIPEEVFEQHIAQTKAECKELTSAGVLELAKQQKREARKRAADAQRQQVLDSYDEVGEWDGDLVLNSISVASIYDLDLPPESIDMVFTDPPYHDEHIDLYSRLGEVAAHVLKPGGYCMAYAGKMFIPDIISCLSVHLEYVSIFAVFQPFSQARIMKHNVFENWRPILVFKKPGKTATKEWTQDVVRGTRDKSHHEWQQDSEAPLQYIAAYTKPSDVVLDPFVGGGTTPWACKQLGRYFVAFDVSDEAVKLSTERVNNASNQTSISEPGQAASLTVSRVDEREPA